MSEKTVKCPKCNQDGAYEHVEEVDIGVGTLRHVFGWECKDCGYVLPEDPLKGLLRDN